MAAAQIDAQRRMAKKFKFNVKRSTSNLPAFFVEPRQLTNTIDGHQSSPKIDDIVHRVTVADRAGRKSLIYSFFLGRGLRLVEKHLAENGVKFASFTGGETTKEKEDIVKRHNTDQLRVLLISKSGAEGLDLKNTSYVHLLEASWNESITQQVIGRARRYKSHDGARGIPKTVKAFRYFACMPPESGVDINTYTGYRALLHFSADEILRKMARDKDVVLTHFLKAIIEWSLDSSK